MATRRGMALPAGAATAKPGKAGAKLRGKARNIRRGKVGSAGGKGAGG